MDTGAGGCLAGEVFGINGVDGGKVVHVRQEHGGLDHVREVHPGGVQNGLQVVQQDSRTTEQFANKFFTTYSTILAYDLQSC